MTNLAVLSALVVFISSFDADPQADALVKQMLSTWSQVSTLAFRMEKTERMCDGEVTFEEVNVKLRNPGDVYLGNIKPKPGQEAIYAPSRNKGELVAHQGSFPDVTVNLSIYGALATKGQHHIITHSGFAYLFDLVRTSLSRARKNPNGERLEFGGTLDFHGRPAKSVILHAGNNAPAQVTAKEDESLFRFASKAGADPFVIAYYNEDLDALTDTVDAGDTLSVPAYYGKKIEFIVDVATNLPLRTTIWGFDDHIYERFEYFDMKVNPPLTDLDFDRENPAYNF